MKSDRFVVRPHSPMRQVALFSGAVVVVLASVGGAYYVGSHDTGFDRLSSGGAEDELRGMVVDLRAENEGLRDQVALLQRSTQVDQQAYSAVGSDLKGLQDEITELREEVTFYRGIVSPAESAAGLRIERIRLEPAGPPQTFNYRLILTQVVKNAGTAQGVLELAIEGRLGGKNKRLSWNEVSVTKERAIDFKFRYFEQFEGQLVLPAGFTPRSVVVAANPVKAKRIERTFDWPDGRQDAGAGVSESSAGRN